MTFLTELEIKEKKFIKTFEQQALQLDLLKAEDIKTLIDLLNVTHCEISNIDSEYAQHLSNLFDIKIISKIENSKNIFTVEIAPITSNNDNKIIFLTQHFGEDGLKKFEIYQLFMNRLQFSCNAAKVEQAKTNFIPKICADMFKLLRSGSAVNLMQQLSNLDRCIELAFLGERLMYQPSIKIKKAIEKDKITDILTQTYEAEETTKGIRTLIDNHSQWLGNIEFRDNQPCTIVFNIELASIKPVVVLLNHGIAGLSYCPRFLSTAHELIHVAHTQQNIHYKDIPLDKLPLIKLAYSNLEEFYTIKLDKNFSENSIADELGYSLRIGHLGYSGLSSKYTEEKKNLMKEALIKASIMNGQLSLKTPEIERYYEAVQANSGQVDEIIINQAYECYKTVLFNLAKEKTADETNMNLSNNPFPLFVPAKENKDNTKELEEQQSNRLTKN